MKRLLLFMFTVIFLLGMTACGGYNGIMREHLSNKDNYYDVDAVFLSYKEADDRIYVYVTVEDKSVFDSSEANNEEIALVLVGDNSDSLSGFLAKEEIRMGDRIAVKCTTWIYSDTTFYYVAEIKTQDKTILPFDDGLENIIKYMDDNKSLF